MRAILRAGGLALLLAAPASAQAGESLEEMERHAREAVRSALGLMGDFVAKLPQYEMPEVLPNGDIVIRRKRQDEEQGAPEAAPRDRLGPPLVQTRI